MPFMPDYSKINSDPPKPPPPGSESLYMCSVYLSKLPGHYKGKSWGELSTLNTNIRCQVDCVDYTLQRDYKKIEPSQRTSTP